MKRVIFRRPRITAFFGHVFCLSLSVALLLQAFSCAGRRKSVSGENVIRYLIPAPRGVTAEPGVQFSFSASTTITIQKELHEREQKGAKELNDALNVFSPVPLRVSREALSTETTGILIGDMADPAIREMLSRFISGSGEELPPAGYILHVTSDRVIIASGTPEGRFYGVQTLIQLLTSDEGQVVVPGVFIRDYPRYDIRGFIDDVSHGQISTELDFRHIVQTMARYKMNTYFLFIDDMFTPTAYPLIGARKGAFSARMLRDLQDEAAEYHVRLVPVFSWPSGHGDMLSIPEFSSLGTFPGSACFDITKAETRVFFREYLSELMGAFTGDMAVMDGGGDSDSLHAYLAEKGLSPAAMRDIFIEYVTVADSIAGSTGKTLYLRLPEFMRDRTGGLPESIGSFEYGDKGFSGTAAETAPRLKAVSLNTSTRFIPDYAGFFTSFTSAAAEDMQGRYGGILPWFVHSGGREFFRRDGWLAYLFSASESWHSGGLPEGGYLTAFMHHFFKNNNTRIEEALRQYLYFSDHSHNNIDMYRTFWEVPFARSYTESEISILDASTRRLRGLKEQLESILEDDDPLRERISSLLLALDQEIWTAKKADYMKRIADLDILAESGKGAKNTPTEIVSLASDLIRDLYLFRDAFQTQWLSANQRPGLDTHVRRYNDLISVIDQKIGRIKEGQFSWNPMLPSRWITTSQSARADRDDGFFFRKTFTAGENIESADIQVKCIPHGEIYLNGQLIAAASSRMYDSPDLLNSSVTMVSCTPYIRPGANCIGIRIFHAPGFREGLHAFCKIRNRDYTIHTVTSDDTWRVSSEPAENWNGADYNDADWEWAETADSSFAERLDFFIPNIDRLTTGN